MKTTIKIGFVLLALVPVTILAFAPQRAPSLTYLNGGVAIEGEMTAQQTADALWTLAVVLGGTGGAGLLLGLVMWWGSRRAMQMQEQAAAENRDFIRKWGVPHPRRTV